MKQTLFIIMLMIGASSISLSKAQGGNAEQELMQIEQDLLNAILKNDASMFERYLADNFISTDPVGGTGTKSEMIKMLKAGDFKFESSTINDMKVHLFDNTAVVTYGTTDKGTVMNFDVSGKYRWTDVFVKLNGQWKLVASQGTSIMQQQ